MPASTHLLLLEGDLHCETGLHVGAGKGSLEIGSSDNPVIKDAFGRPYIPVSSLRGRLRSLLEQSSGLAVPAELVYLSRRRGQEVRIHQSDRPDDEICILFGRNSGRMERVVGDALESSQSSPARLAAYGLFLQFEYLRRLQTDDLSSRPATATGFYGQGSFYFPMPKSNFIPWAAASSTSCR